MQIEATGKSVEIAIQNGLLECGMKREDVKVTVLEEGGLCPLFNFSLIIKFHVCV